MPLIGLDVGTAYCKAYGDTGRVIFPSMVLMRRKTVWNRIKRRPLTLVGEAAEKALAEKGRLLRPVREGRVVHEDTYQTVVLEALYRLGLPPEQTRAVVGTLCRPTEEEMGRLEKILKERVKLGDVQVYPASLGALLAMGLDSGVVVDIGEGTTGYLAVEDREVVDFGTTAVATDSVLDALHDLVLTDLEADLKKEEIRMLVTGSRKTVSRYTATLGVKTVTGEKIKEMAKQEAVFFAEELAEWMRTYLASAPTSALENPILTGGGSLIYREALTSLIPEVSFKVPTDVIYANAEGLFKIAKETFAAPPLAPAPTSSVK